MHNTNDNDPYRFVMVVANQAYAESLLIRLRDVCRTFETVNQRIAKDVRDYRREHANN